LILSLPHLKEHFKTPRSERLPSNVLIKYITKELALYFLVAFLFFFMIFFVNQILLIAEDLLSKRAPFVDVCKIMIYSLPFIIAQSAPFATLVGFLMCLGRMMSDNEILIFRASGQPFRTILIPVMALGIVISLLSFVVNDYLLPVGTIEYSKLYRKIMQSNPSVELESNSVKQLGDSTIVIGEVVNGQVSDIVMFDKSSKNEERIIVAQNSSLVGAKDEGVLMQLNMNDTVLSILKNDNKKNYDVIAADNLLLNVFDSVFSGNYSVSPREMTSYDLKIALREMRQAENPDTYRINIWNMEYYKKFALPFGSIFFAFLAFSIAFLFGKHNGQTIGLLLGIVISVLYWAMQITGQLLVTRNGLNGFWSMWLPNVIIGGVGFIFYIVLLKK